MAFDPSASPALSRFLDHVQVAVAVHGYGRPDMWTTLLVGGRNRTLAAALRSALEGTLGDGFRVVDDVEASPCRCAASIPAIRSTCPRGRGLNELPPRVRPGTGAPTFRSDYEEAVTEALASVASAAAANFFGPKGE